MSAVPPSVLIHGVRFFPNAVGREWPATRGFLALLFGVTSADVEFGRSFAGLARSVPELVTVAVGDLAPTAGDCATWENDYAPCVWHGDEDARYDTPEDRAFWWRDRDEESSWGVTNYCGCGCRGIYNWCDDCNRRVAHERDYGSPRTNSLYHLCTECRQKWERTGKSED